MVDRVHPMPPPPHPASPPSPGKDDAAATETTPLHPAFHAPPAAPPGMYIVQIPKDQVLRVPPPDRARRYRALAGRPARQRRLRRACCAACGAALLLLLAAAALVGAVYLVFRPRAPAFSVSSLSIRGLDGDASSPVALGLAVRADNGANGKVGVDYRGGGEVSVSYSGTRLAAGSWPAFRQPPRNVTALSATLSGAGVSFSDEQRKQLAAEQAARAVPLTVEARVPVRLLFGKVLRTWTVDVKATCQVTVDTLAGEAAAANRGCRVKVRPFLWWWW
ncbi:NDR1/HIN1-like protein 13 [Lolium perenne]|uniref:NDR1/HIN1-like protein 13 n=1 Tax=Lolium perenne TaxID=4522 RepID=UPI0021EA54ED|nr:NDR1/HIN1-like protein 13 [Lolium perenne]